MSMTSPSPTSGWAVVEMMGDDRTLIFDEHEPKGFTGINRPNIGGRSRRNSIGKALNTLALDIKAGEDQPQLDRDGVRLTALPVMGPVRDCEPYAAQVWVTPTDDPTPLHPRTIGTMLWDPRNNGSGADPITYHHPITDGTILGYDPPQEERVSSQIFRHYQKYPQEHVLGPWVRGIMSGHIPTRETFNDVLDITRVNGDLLRVHVAMRAVKLDGTYVIRGVIHDISDFQSPVAWSGFDKQTARAAIRAFAGEDGDKGCGHVNFATGIVLEWIIKPPGALGVWEKQNAQWDDEELYFSNLERAKNGERISFTANIRFSDGSPHLISATIVPANPGDSGNGLLIVNETDDDDPSAFHPLW